MLGRGWRCALVCLRVCVSFGYVCFFNFCVYLFCLCVCVFLLCVCVCVSFVCMCVSFFCVCAFLMCVCVRAYIRGDTDGGLTLLLNHTLLRNEER